MKHPAPHSVMSSMRYLIAVLFIPVLACAAQEPTASIPFEYDGHIFFSATVNGQPARLLYDPVDGLMLDRVYVNQRPGWNRDWRQAGMAQPALVRGGGAAEIEVTFADSVVLELGALRRTFPRVPVIPLDSMMGSAINGTADGLIGTTVLAAWALRLDFPRRQAELLDPTTIDTTGWQVLPLRFDGARASTMIELRFPDGSRESLRTQVDFGMGPALRVVTREVDARNLLRHASGATADTLGRGLGGALTSVRFEGATIILGALESRPHRVSLAREPTGADANPRGYDALMGLGLLSEFDVIYDPTNQRLLVRASR